MTQSDAAKDSKIALSLIVSIALAVGSLLLFAWLADEMLEQETTSFDQYLRLGIHAYATPALTVLMKWITTLGSTVSLSIISFFLALSWWRSRRRDAIRLAITMIGASLLSTSLKIALHRPRPEPFFGIPMPESLSFPSGHALSAICFFGVIAHLAADKRHSRATRVMMWIAAVTAILLIGGSRIYLGVHYPSDVAGGYLAGFAWLLGMRIVESQLFKPSVPTSISTSGMNT